MTIRDPALATLYQRMVHQPDSVRSADFADLLTGLGYVPDREPLGASMIVYTRGLAYPVCITQDDGFLDKSYVSGQLGTIEENGP